jgi:hypothetical protein
MKFRLLALWPSKDILPASITCDTACEASVAVVPIFIVLGPPPNTADCRRCLSKSRSRYAGVAIKGAVHPSGILGQENLRQPHTR